MTTTRRAGASILEVPLNDGTRWRGTEAQLRRDHPDWLPYAQFAQRSAPLPASPHGTGHFAGLHPEDQPSTTDDQGGEEKEEEADDLSGYPDVIQFAAPKSAVRSMQRYTPSDQRLSSFPEHWFDVHVGAPPPVRRASAQRETEAAAHARQQRRPTPNRNRSQPPDVVHLGPRQKRFPRLHVLFWFGVALALMVIGGWLLTTVSAWWTNTQNQWLYGYPRTAHYNAVVGHHDSAAHPLHFIALNLNGQVEIIEFPGGDATHARIYTDLQIVGPNAPLVPVTLSFQSIDGQSQPAMIVIAGNSRYVFLNVKGQFLQSQHQ